MSYRVWLVIFGSLDLLIALVFIVFPLISTGTVSLYDDAISAIESGRSFFDNKPHLAYFFAIPYVLTATVILSAPLLLFHKKSGVYISVIQSIFRLTGLMMPTFFFFSYLYNLTGSVLPSVVLGIFFEVMKIYILIRIIQSKNGFLVRIN